MKPKCPICKTTFHEFVFAKEDGVVNCRQCPNPKCHRFGIVMNQLRDKKHFRYAEDPDRRKNPSLWERILNCIKEMNHD
jgi:hypothetical protein